MKARSRISRLLGERLEDRRLLVVPDFQLSDVNPDSETYQDPVSPRDYLEQVSGWYFIHTT
jgi:hypothetical protein